MDKTREYTGTDETATASRTRAQAAAFCQECGRPLAAEEVRRTVHGVFCQPCTTQRFAAQSGWQAVRTGSATGMQRPGDGHRTGGGGSPFVAGVLGAIPGVGAMYNGQYAKGALHLVGFVVLISLADNLSWVFYWLVWGWVFYQIFDAYHTARARRDGLPLPNPFGWNDVGERFGFGRATPPPPMEQGWKGRPTEPPAAGSFSYTPAASAQPKASPTGAAWKEPEPVQPISDRPYAVPFSGTRPPAPAQSGTASYMANVPYRSTYVGESVSSPMVFDIKQPERRFPAGALVLIALGVLFLLGNLLPEFHLNGRWLVPALLAAISLWAAFRRLNQIRSSLGPTQIVPGIARAVTGPSVLFTLAVLLSIDAADLLSIRRSWPLLLVVWGCMLLIQRAYNTQTSLEVPELAESVDLSGQDAPGTGTLGL